MSAAKTFRAVFGARRPSPFTLPAGSYAMSAPRMFSMSSASTSRIDFVPMCGETHFDHRHASSATLLTSLFRKVSNRHPTDAM